MRIQSTHLFRTTAVSHLLAAVATVTLLTVLLLPVAIIPAPLAADPALPTICLTGLPQEEVEKTSVTCEIHGTIDLSNKEVCVEGGTCKGDNITITIELDEPECFILE